MNCYVLAGGRSRRMGRSKINLDFDGSTFLQRVTNAARAVFEEVLAVQRSDGAPLAGVATVFEHTHEAQAPVFGVRAALQHATGKCVVLAIDYPLITPEILRDLRDRFEAAATQLLVPVWNGKAQMLAAGYDASLLPILDSRLAAGRLDLRGLIDEVEAVVVEERELRARHVGEPLMNVNTPSELEEARRLHGKRLLAFR